MVPNSKEPLYTRLLGFISERRITFAASNFDTTSELTLQIVWWGQWMEDEIDMSMTEIQSKADNLANYIQNSISREYIT